MSDYPYISDKKMYAAVMGACSWIRQDGYFNKAVKYYADKYSVDEDELAKHIRERQKIGREKKKSEGYKYKYFVVKEEVATDANPEPSIKIYVKKGKSARTVQDSLNENDLKRTIRADYGGSYAPYYTSIILKEFDSKKEADLFADDFDGADGMVSL